MNNQNKDQQDDNHNPANETPRPTRRQFLKGLTTGTVAIGALTQAGCGPALPRLQTRGATATTTVCPFRGVGWGPGVPTRAGTVLHIEGEPGHPMRGCT